MTEEVFSAVTDFLRKETAWVILTLPLRGHSDYYLSFIVIYFSSSVERVMQEKFIDQTGTVAFTSFITQQA